MRADTKKAPNGAFCLMQKDVAEWTGLEPATLDVTGRYSNQLNYHSALDSGEPGNQIPKSVILQHPRAFSRAVVTKKALFKKLPYRRIFMRKADLSRGLFRALP